MATIYPIKLVTCMMEYRPPRLLPRSCTHTRRYRCDKMIHIFPDFGPLQSSCLGRRPLPRTRKHVRQDRLPLPLTRCCRRSAVLNERPNLSSESLSFKARSVILNRNSARRPCAPIKPFGLKLGRRSTVILYGSELVAASAVLTFGVL